MSQIRESFEKAMFNNPEFVKKHSPDQMALALEAAKWMAERCAEITESLMTGEKHESHESAKDARSFMTSVMIRQLAKDLEP